MLPPPTLLATAPSWPQYLALALALSSVPAAQVWAVYVHGPGPLLSRRVASEAIVGGVRHFIFQVMSWLAWLVSIMFATPLVTPPDSLSLPPSHAGVVWGAAIALSIVGLVFMINAVLVYEPAAPPAEKKSRKGSFSTSFAFYTVFVLGSLLMLVAGMLMAATDHLPDARSRLLYLSISVSCAAIAVGVTHGLGGFLRHGPRSKHPTSWQFFQPFAGGSVFVATQALGWTLFSITLLFVLKWMMELLMGIVRVAQWWALSTGLMLVITQMVLGFSLFTFRGQPVAANSGQRKHLRLAHCLVITLVYLPVQTFSTVWLFIFSSLPLTVSLTVWVAVMVPYYAFTTYGRPRQTGCRKWSWFQKWATDNIAGLEALFGTISVTSAVASRPDPNLRYIFGYHPHGLYPSGAAFMTLTKDFRDKWPGIQPVTLAASAMFSAPIYRDMLSWLGYRDVSRSSFEAALQEDRSVLICPGGQEELVEAYRAFHSPSELVLCTRHKGFCRIAIEQQACLVPTLALGELFTLSNLLDWPQMQRKTYKLLGFPVPYLVVGRWGLSPLPRKVPLKFFVGEPIAPPEHQAGSEVPADAVDKLHRQYYEALVDLFHKFKFEHPWYKDTEVVLEGPISTLRS
eukprot:evm.model.scf_27.11 EVM.evm.TU.scf_27.11   scf_27:83458-88282(-)